MTRTLPSILCTLLLVTPFQRALSQVEPLSDGVVIAHDGGWLKVTVESERILRVSAAKDRAFFTRPSLIVLPRTAATPSANTSAPV